MRKQKKSTLKLSDIGYPVKELEISKSLIRNLRSEALKLVKSMEYAGTCGKPLHIIKVRPVGLNSAVLQHISIQLAFEAIDRRGVHTPQPIIDMDTDDISEQDLSDFNCFINSSRRLVATPP